MKEAFVHKEFRGKSLEIIDHANAIIDAYRAQGFTLTLRQLYYQFVSRDLLPNRQSEYKRLGAIVSDARIAGMIDWSSIEDRTRNVRTHAYWSNPSSIIDSAAYSYAEDRWEGQPRRVEVWIEKDALIGVIEPVCRRFQVPYFACRGYSSQSEQYSAGARFGRQRRRGLRPLVLHLGDHDPSGMDMTRDNADRLAMFARSGVEVRRLALNYDQIEQYDPPPNPAKETDSRSGPYIEQFGESSWELDALEPTVIDKLIADAIDGEIDPDPWEAARAGEEANKAKLKAIAERWSEVEAWLAEQDGDEDEDEN